MIAVYAFDLAHYVVHASHFSKSGIHCVAVSFLSSSLVSHLQPLHAFVTGCTVVAMGSSMHSNHTDV